MKKLKYYLNNENSINSLVVETECDENIELPKDFIKWIIPEDIEGWILPSLDGWD